MSHIRMSENLSFAGCSTHNGTYIRTRPGVPQFQDPAKVCLITLINWFYIYRAVFLATWREIPDSSERQYLIENVLGHTADAVADKMRAQGSLLIHSFLSSTLSHNL